MFKQTFTANRTTVPYWPSIIKTLQNVDPTVRLDPIAGDGFTATIGKSTAWSSSDISQTQSLIDNADADSIALRTQMDVDNISAFDKTLFLTAIDETNRIRQWITDFKAAVAAATSLADLKTRIAALNDLPQVPMNVAIQAMKNKAGTL